MTKNNINRLKSKLSLMVFSDLHCQSNTNMLPTMVIEVSSAIYATIYIGTGVHTRISVCACASLRECMLALDLRYTHLLN